MASSRLGRCTRTGCRESCSGTETDGAKARGINVLFCCWEGLSARLSVEWTAPAHWSVEPNRLMRTVERKRRNADPEAVAAPGLHFVAAHHDARRRRQR